MTDTSEIVRRLRFWMPTGSKHLEEDLAEAADRIEALEAQNKRLREALATIVDGGTTGRSQSPALNMPDENWLHYRINDLERIARAALKETEG